MPNWVYNSVNVTGDTEEIDKFISLINTKPALVDNDDWNATNSPFSFHSFITPDESVTNEEYHGNHGSEVDPITGSRKVVGDTRGNWYNWNVANWGVKWDASSIVRHTSTSIKLDGSGTSQNAVSIQFETPWSPPDPVFRAMVEQFPELHFDIEYEEEQGWGGTYEGENGDLTALETWDIPNSHADYVARSREDSCNCSVEEETEYWYDDCPRKTPDPVYHYEVVVKTIYQVTAPDKDSAKAVVEAHESDYELPKDSKVISSSYNAVYEITEGEQVENEEPTDE